MYLREKNRRATSKQAKAKQTKADSGELKSEKGVYNWDDKWENYLSTVPR